MEFILILLSIFNSYKVTWENDYFDIPLYDNVSNYFDLPVAKLYDSNGNELETATSYLKGVNHTSISVVNSNHVKLFKVDYRVYFEDYSIRFDHTIYFNIIDDIAPEILSVPTLKANVKQKLLNEKDIVNEMVFQDNYYSKEELIVRIIGLNLVNNLVPKIYEIKIELIDPSNNITKLTTSYEIINDNIPDIKYSTPLILDYGDDFKYYNFFKISDPFDNNLMIDVNISFIDFNKLGTYLIVVKVVNNGGNINIVETKITIKDSKPPNLGIINNKILNVNQYNNEILKSFIIDVSDNFTNINSEDIIITEQVNFNELGKYEVIYEVEDCSGNKTVKKLAIEIKDLEKPIIILKEELLFEVFSENNFYYNYFNYYDNYCDNSDLIIQFKDKNINFKKPGVYYLEVTIQDLSKNITMEIFNVNIVDSKSPIVNQIEEIIINDYTIKDVNYFISYFNVSDNYTHYLDLEFILVGQINYSVKGSYPVGFYIYDCSNNVTIHETFIYIIDDTSPTIKFTNDYLILFIGQEVRDYNYYIEYVNDNCDNPEDLLIEVIDKVNYHQIGKYEVLFKVKDKSFNECIQVLDVYIDIKYEKMLDGSNLTIYKDEYFTIGTGMIFGENIKNIKTYPEIIDTSSLGEQEITYIAYDNRGNVDKFTQTINIIEEKRNFKLKTYQYIIIINVAIFIYLGYKYYCYKQVPYFDNE